MKTAHRFWAPLFWLLGLLISLWPTVSSGFKQYQMDAYDCRLIHFTLETTWRAVSEWGFSFWNAVSMKRMR